MAKISLTRILSELKLTDKKIESLIEKPYIATYQKRSPVINLKPVNEFEKEAKENLQAIKDLLSHKLRLRKALAKANAKTKVFYKGQEYSINELISLKSDLIPLKEKIRQTFREKITKIKTSYEKNNAELNLQVQRMLEQNLGKDRKASGDEYDLIAKPFIEQNQAVLSDAADVQGYEKELESEVLSFIGEVDILLSEVNSKTEVEI